MKCNEKEIRCQEGKEQNMVSKRETGEDSIGADVAFWVGFLEEVTFQRGPEVEG